MNSTESNSLFSPLDFSSKCSISPTDIGNFQRLQGCERFLRLRLHTANHDSSWLEKQGLRKQTIPPLLTFSGADFEKSIEGELATVNTSHPLTGGTLSESEGRSSSTANERLLSAARDLKPGQLHTEFQVGLEVEIDDWRLKGVLDIVRLQRTEDGKLHFLIVDMKASQRAKVEHRLQLAFYHRMVDMLFTANGVVLDSLQFGVLYKGPQNLSEVAPHEQETLRTHRAAAEREWGLSSYYFEVCDDKTTYLNSLDKLVFNRDSQARLIAEKEFDKITFHLSAKCDACVFGEFCLRDAAQSQDLTLLPYLTLIEKESLQKHGIGDITQLAALKQPRQTTAQAHDPRRWNELETPPANQTQVAAIAGDRQVGARLDELIHRAHAFTKTPGFKSYIPSKGEGTLPYVTPDVNANIVRIYLDGGLDYVNNRAYMLGALFVAYREGVEATRRSVVALSPAAPSDATIEGALVEDFLAQALDVAVEMAKEAEYIDEHGEIRFAAPVHITFFDGRSQKIWLETLSRHIPAVMAGAPIFDFLKQLPTGDSFVVSTLDSEARDLKNFPLVAPSLQALGRYLKFDWNEFPKLFRRGLFDDSSTLDEDDRWYTARSRFSSQIPLEYAYDIWGLLPNPTGNDLFQGFRGRTPEELLAFGARRLEAIEHIAGRFRGNTKTSIRPYDLDSLINFGVKDPTYIDALQTFLQLERLAELGAWKAARHAPPERRMLAGDSLVVQYFDADQVPQARDQNRKNREVIAAQKAYRENNPGNSRFPKEIATNQVAFDFSVKLRIDASGCDCSLDDALAMMTMREGDFVWLLERETVDGRLPQAQQVRFHPTVRQLLTWSKSAILKRGPYRENGSVFLEVEAGSKRSGDNHNFVFGTANCLFEDGETYSLDPSPNDWSGSSCFKENNEIHNGTPNFGYDVLSGNTPSPSWPQSAQQGQLRFLNGLEELAKENKQFAFEASKRRYIGEEGGAPLLLVQGPPGTGKTYATAFALLARMQGAMAAGLPWRGLITAHTHSAVNVALRDVNAAQVTLREVQEIEPELFSRYFDARLLDIPLFRLQGTSTDFEAESHLIPLWSEKKEADRYGFDFTWPRGALLGHSYCIAGAVPGGIRKVWKADKKSVDGPYFNAMIVDEASQMNQPLACLASVANAPNSSLIVVGDPRQMPPITKHEWEGETHRIFEGQAAFDSLYGAVAAKSPPTIKFEESFRLHPRMAQFLREAIYEADGINYHSKQTRTLSTRPSSDPFLRAVLSPEHPIVLIEHAEAASILENPSENEILRPILELLTDAGGYALDAGNGLGIVVPHRAQRALLADSRWKVDTVERFQGDQRRVMAFSATESDPAYLLQNGAFLLDPRRLCVSLSRAKEKLILVASKSVFDLVPLDEQTFLNARLWYKLRDEFCTHALWEGELGSTKAKVLGSGL